MLVSLLVCLIPTTIGALISAIGIAGMDRLVQHNVLAMSGRAVEAAGDVDTLLLDKTGTITLGNRQATEFVPVPGVTEGELADAAQLASLADETPEGRSIVVLAKEKYRIRGRELRRQDGDVRAVHGADAHVGRQPRRPRNPQGRGRCIAAYVKGNGGAASAGAAAAIVERIARAGGTPLVVAERTRALGVIHLKDIVKGGMRQRFAALRAMGIKTVMITGDNPLTAASIAQRGRRRRFSGAGDAGRQDDAHQARAGRGQARRDDRRRHERRAGAGAGRRRRRDEHRHARPPRKPATWSISTRTRPS